MKLAAQVEDVVGEIDLSVVCRGEGQRSRGRDLVGELQHRAALVRPLSCEVLKHHDSGWKITCGDVLRGSGAAGRIARVVAVREGTESGSSAVDAPSLS